MFCGVSHYLLLNGEIFSNVNHRQIDMERNITTNSVILYSREQ